MTIKRTVDGKEMEFELTPHELYRAFEEQEHIFDITAVRDYVCGWEDEDFMDIWSVTRVQYEELVEDMAWCRRRYINKYEMSEDFALDEAIKDTITENYGS